MSNRGGKALGIFAVLIGAGACIAGYNKGWPTVFIGGLIIFGLAAYLLDSSSMREAVKEYKDDAVDLIPGRRSGDTKEVQIKVPKSGGGD